MGTAILSGTILKPDDTAIPDCTVIAKLRPINSGIRVSDQTVISGRKETTTAANGSWSLTLEKNGDMTPAGTHWEITLKIPAAYGGEAVYAVVVASDSNLAEAGIATVPAVEDPVYVTIEEGDQRWGEAPSERAILTSMSIGAAARFASEARKNNDAAIAAAAAFAIDEESQVLSKQVFS